MKQYTAAAIVILLFVVQSILHYLIGTQLHLSTEHFFQIYGFLFLITIVILLVIELSNIHFKEQLGFIFLAIIVFKFIVAFLFMKMTDMSEAPQKYHFLIAYLFLVIMFTIYVAQKLLNTDKKH